MQGTQVRSHSELLRALNNTAYESLQLALWVKIDEKKDLHPIYQFGKMCDDIILFKPASITLLKDSHQFSCKIQVLNCKGYQTA